MQHLTTDRRERSAFERGFVVEVDGTVVGMACLRLLPCLAA